MKQLEYSKRSSGERLTRRGDAYTRIQLCSSEGPLRVSVDRVFADAFQENRPSLFRREGAVDTYHKFVRNRAPASPRKGVLRFRPHHLLVSPLHRLLLLRQFDDRADAGFPGSEGTLEL